MQENLQSLTFNKHNYIKHEYKNYRRNPLVNRISQDLSYKNRSITDAKRSPWKISAGNDYLYARRIEQLKRMLKAGSISLTDYNIAVEKLKFKMYGKPMTEPTTQQTTQQTTNETNDESNEEEEQKETSEEVKNKPIKQDTPKEIIELIKSKPETKPTNETQTNE